MRELANVFESLDLNHDGKLSKEELIAGYITQMGPAAAEQEAERVMNSVDIDHNGKIDYSEFISASMNKAKLLTKDRLKTAFDHFDTVRHFISNAFLEQLRVYKYSLN